MELVLVMFLENEKQAILSQVSLLMALVEYIPSNGSFQEQERLD
jgi:hypothetical protein